LDKIHLPILITGLPNNNNNNNNNNKAKEEEKNKKVTKFWIQKVKNDRIIPNNNPDIIIRDNVKGTCLITDNAISGDRNAI